ncbi:MAG: CinA family protein [Rhizomicrobium sp.]|jgi:nicotinamide-nucleotide amidase
MFAPQLLALAKSVLSTSRAKRLRIVTAESCTGGLISVLLTEIPGSSDVLDRGYVVYSNQAKSEMLGVPTDFITKHGAVSEEVARVMAQGALAHSDAQLAVAVTGIAGPGGGSDSKPVGLVHIAVARNNGALLHEEHRFGDIGRRDIRMRSVEAALKLLQRLL